MVEAHITGNGARLLLEDIVSTDVVSVGFWFLHGSRDESAAERGYSHFLEHMLFKGTQKRSAFKIALDIDRVGGNLNGFTEKEYTCFYCTLPKEHLYLAIDVLSDMIFYSKFDPADIEKEKLVVINEIEATKDSPEEVAHDLYLEGFWKSNTIAQKIAGETEDIEEINREKLLAFYSERYNPTNLIVSVAGNFNRQEITTHLEGLLRQLPSSPYKTHRVPPERFHSWEFKPDKFKQVHIYTGTDFALETRSLVSLYSTLVFSTVVGEAMSSRLFQTIREEMGLCYSIMSYRSIYSDIGLWSIYTNTTPKQVPLVIKALNDELNKLLVNPPTEQEVADAKSHLAGGFILSKDDMETRMRRMVRLYCFLGHLVNYEQILEALNKVEVTDVLSVMRKLIKSTNFNLLAYGGKINGFGKLRFNF